MLSKSFQRTIYRAYKANHDATIHHGNYEYGIAYNACASIHTWIIRKGIHEKNFHWLQPLDESIK